MDEKIQVISTVTIQRSSDLYKVVDALNRTLKNDDLMFGLALDENDEEKMVFKIYRT
ncbi:YpmA family protein [Halalkalibacterium ligniniphilum]|uniref:YpmA family protein n=1 Tax=Halalkalibacterium ligniniphilum TaxID=1134413 RepID=UPI0003469BA6|nr:YpmA family protein [Halalkalibacterium ligniniphilum]